MTFVCACRSANRNIGNTLKYESGFTSEGAPILSLWFHDIYDMIGPIALIRLISCVCRHTADPLMGTAHTHKAFVG